MSFSQKLIVHDDRVAVKLYQNGKFTKSFIIPTNYRPLPCKKGENGKYQGAIFTDQNTEPIKDQKMLDILAKIPVMTGRCYTTARAVYNALSEAGYDVKTYEGWFFCGWEKAIHHCVAVVDNHFIDFSCSKYEDEEVIRRLIEKGYENPTPQQQREVTVDVIADWKTKNIIERNPDIGQVHPGYIFVGVEETPENARKHFNELMDKYPDHEDYNDGMGMTRYGNLTNKMLAERGIK